MTTRLFRRVSVLLAALMLPLLFLFIQFQIANSHTADGPEGDRPPDSTTVQAADAPYEPAVTRRPVEEVDPASMQHDCNTAGNPLVNCGFETGDFSGWVTTDLTTPLFPLMVGGGGIDLGYGFFVSQPTEGSWAALHGFDGDGPGVIQIAQDVSLPDSTEYLLFDYRGAWDLTFGATQDRLFQVSIGPYGGGVPTQTTTILTAIAGMTVTDTGALNGGIDLSAFAGTSVRVSFDWVVPEAFSGPAFFQLDNVLVVAHPEPGLYGSTVDGEIIFIDVETGAAELVGTLPVLITEIEYDNFSGRAFVQEADGFFQGYEINLRTGQIINGPIFNNGAYNGIEYVGDTAFGAVIFAPLGASELRTLDPFSGSSALIGSTGVGPISGLAFDEDNGIMYGTGGGGITTTNFYTLDLATGVASVVGSTGIRAGGLQFGLDGRLYAGTGGTIEPGNLYEIDPDSGAATLVGPTGFGKISGLTLVGIDVSLEKSAAPEPAVINQDLTYMLVVKNHGPITATNIIMTDTLPDSVIFVSASASQGSCGQDGGVITCNLGLLTNDSQATVEIVVLPTIEGDIDNTAIVTADEPDYNLKNNVASTVSSVVLNKLYLPILIKP